MHCHTKTFTADGAPPAAASNLRPKRSLSCGRTITPASSSNRYDFDDKTVTVYWIDAEHQKLVPKFGEFNADGDRMVQIKNDAGPRREFHRC